MFRNSAKVGNTWMYLIVKLFLETERRWLRWATSTSWALRRRSYDLSKWRSFWVKTNSIAEAANNSAEEKSRSRSTSKFIFFSFFCEKTSFLRDVVSWLHGKIFQTFFMAPKFLQYVHGFKTSPKFFYTCTMVNGNEIIAQNFSKRPKCKLQL